MTTPKPRTLICNADLLTMDPHLGDVSAVDLLIERDRIAGVGQNLVADDAEVIDATGMILMPGMIDGHRHVWESVLLGHLVKTSKRYKTYLVYNNQMVAVCFRPEDVYLGNYLGGLLAIDTGVTSVVDHCHIVHTPEKGEAAARGLKDAGIGGVFCYTVTHTPSYGPGQAVGAKQAWAEFVAGPDPWHLEHAAKIRKTHFSAENDLLRFGVGLGFAEGGPRTVEFVRQEMISARDLAPALITQHVFGGEPREQNPARKRPSSYQVMNLPESYTLISDFYKAGLLKPEYQLSHGNDLTDTELGMLRECGCKVCATTMGEFGYDNPSIHFRAKLAGIPVSIGIDVPLAYTNDYFEHIRASFWSLFRSEAGAKFAGTLESSDVLAFATSEGARGIGQEDEIGSITIGKRADLVLLRTDRFAFPTTGTLADRVVNFAHQGDIDSVWVAGALRKRHGSMIGVDWAREKARADDARLRATQLAETITFVT